MQVKTFDLPGVERAENIQDSISEILRGDASDATSWLGGETCQLADDLEYARKVGAGTIAVTANPAGGTTLRCDVVIAPRVGPEVLTGSTRLKAGTAQKLVLNMLTTGAMVRLGKVYENLMVDLRTASRKLEERTKRVFMSITGASYDETGPWLKRAGGSLKVAIVMRRAGVTRGEAVRRLKEAQGWVREAIRS